MYYVREYGGIRYAQIWQVERSLLNPSSRDAAHYNNGGNYLNEKLKITFIVISITQITRLKIKLRYAFFFCLRNATKKNIYFIYIH